MAERLSGEVESPAAGLTITTAAEEPEMVVSDNRTASPKIRPAGRPSGFIADTFFLAEEPTGDGMLVDPLVAIGAELDELEAPPDCERDDDAIDSLGAQIAQRVECMIETRAASLEGTLAKLVEIERRFYTDPWNRDFNERLVLSVMADLRQFISSKDAAPRAPSTRTSTEPHTEM